jgi:hypothetical protein
MANSWSIIIEQVGNDGVAFRPDVPGGQRGQPLGVKSGDDVTWNNTTDLDLELVSIPPGTFLTDPIPAGQVSDPIFNVTQAAGETITYSCVQPSQPQHSIAVVP